MILLRKRKKNHRNQIKNSAKSVSKTMGLSSSHHKEAHLGGAKKGNVDLSRFAARVDSVNVGGLGRTYDDYVNRAVQNLFKAKTFNEVVIEVKRSMQQLEELGIYKSLNARIDVSHGKNASENGYEVSFNGVELSRLTGKIGTEIGQNEGAVTAELATPNIFGRGERLAFHVGYSNHKTTDINIKLTKPFYHTFLGDYKPETSIILSKYSAEYPWSKYRTENLGVILETAFLLPAPVQHTVQLDTSFREIGLTGRQVPLFLRKNCGPRMATILRHTCTIDERDSITFPSRGIFLRSTHEIAGLAGGNVGYKSINTHAEINVPFFAGISAQFCGRFGYILPAKMSPPVPISSLFTLGGPQSLRGYVMAGAGNHVDGIPTGAHSYMAAGAHLWTPLPFFSRQGFANLFRLHLFLNCGKTDSFTIDANDLASVYGLGMAVRIGERARIEFNYCEPLTNKNSQYLKKGFQFGIGFDFI